MEKSPRLSYKMNVWIKKISLEQPIKSIPTIWWIRVLGRLSSRSVFFFWRWGQHFFFMSMDRGRFLRVLPLFFTRFLGGGVMSLMKLLCKKNIMLLCNAGFVMAWFFLSQRKYFYLEGFSGATLMRVSSHPKRSEVLGPLLQFSPLIILKFPISTPCFYCFPRPVSLGLMRLFWITRERNLLRD